MLALAESFRSGSPESNERLGRSRIGDAALVQKEAVGGSTRLSRGTASFHAESHPGSREGVSRLGEGGRGGAVAGESVEGF